MTDHRADPNAPDRWPGLEALVPRMRPFQASVFAQMSALATRLGAINLGQGFPDTDGPEELKAIAVRSIVDGSGNQYPPGHGLPDLRLAIAEHQHRMYGLGVDPITDVVVTTGASEALAATLLALIDTGDEVIVLEPFFDLYAAAIALAGGVQVTVPLVVPSQEFASEPASTSAPGTGERAPGEPASGFRLDADALAAAITDRTRLILLNSPHNPTGMVLDRAELQQIADLAIAHDLIVLSDEAYEHLYFAPSAHVPIATLPGMFERTVSVGSGGKSFSFTGWKVGWASGPTHLIAAVRVVRQHLSYVSGGPFQPAIAAGLRLPDAYFEQFRIELMAKRDHLSAGLTSLGFGVIPSQGTYFLITDVRPLGYVSGTDFCRELPARAGVVAIPVAALAQRHEQFDSFVRWTFCKRREVLDAALDRLATGAE